MKRLKESLHSSLKADLSFNCGSIVLAMKAILWHGWNSDVAVCYMETPFIIGSLTRLNFNRDDNDKVGQHTLICLALLISC